MVVAVEHKVIQGGIRAKNVVITFVATFLVVCLSFTTFIPSAFGILVYKNLTSRDSCTELQNSLKTIFFKPFSILKA